jgi:hypothetical protein
MTTTDRCHGCGQPTAPEELVPHPATQGRYCDRCWLVVDELAAQPIDSQGITP